MADSVNKDKRILQITFRNEDLVKEIDACIERYQMRRSLRQTSSLEEIRARIKELENELDMLKRKSERWPTCRD